MYKKNKTDNIGGINTSASANVNKIFLLIADWILIESNDNFGSFTSFLKWLQCLYALEDDEGKNYIERYAQISVDIFE